MKKRLAALLLALGLSVSLLPTAALAAGTYWDVPEDHPAYQEIQYVTQTGLMNGTGDGFQPDGTFTRGMFVTVLGRMAGINPVGYPGSQFKDVDAKNPAHWYAPYVQWASQTKLVNGTGGGNFSPNDPITREQCATIFYRYLDRNDLCSGNAYRMVCLSDALSVGNYAGQGVFYLVSRGLMDLAADGAFVPQGNLTRADLAVTLSRLDQSKLKGEVAPWVEMETAAARIQDYYNAAKPDDGNYVAVPHDDKETEEYYHFVVRYQMTDAEVQEILSWGGIPNANQYVTDVRVEKEGGLAQTSWNGVDWTNLTRVN